MVLLWVAPDRGAKPLPVGDAEPAGTDARGPQCEALTGEALTGEALTGEALTGEALTGEAPCWH